MATSSTLRWIEDRIRFCEGRWTVIDADLAAWFGLPTNKLLECIHHNEPVAGELAFHPDRIDLPVVTGQSRMPEYVFTEHGIIAAAFMLGSAAAIARGVELIRVFARRGHAPPPVIDFPEFPHFQDPHCGPEARP